MNSFVQLITNPFSFNYDFDRNRRTDYLNYGTYKPTRLKRLMIWLMNERIEPVDWEEVPPFVEPEEEETYLKVTRDATVHPYECLTQPNMLTTKDIYTRRVLLLGVFYILYRHIENNVFKYKPLYGFHNFYFLRSGFKFLTLVWFYYITCRIYVNKDYQLPYN